MRKRFAGILSLMLLSGLLMLVSVLSAHADRKLVFTKHFNESLFDITEKAEFSVEIILDEKEYKIGRDVIGLEIHDSHNRDLENASVTVDYRNVDTGESVSKGAVVKEEGRGLYTVSGLYLNKEGRWKLTVTVSKHGIKDSAQFLFPDVLKKKWPAGKYVP